MNNPARNAVIICGDGTRPERDDPKTYQQNPPQPTASSRLPHSPSPMHHLRLFLAIYRLSLFPLFAVSPPSSPIISSPLVPTHSLPFSPTLPSLSSFSLYFQCPIPHPFIPLPASFHFPSGFLSFPFPHPFISIPTSSHSPSGFLSFPVLHPFISIPASSHSPSRILSFPFLHPFISIPTPFHFHSRFAPLQAPSNDLQIQSSRPKLRTAHEGVNTNLTCSEPGRTRPHDGSEIAPDGD